MSKVKSQFPTGNFYLRGGKDGNGVIHIRYFINGRYVHKSTGIKIDPKMWDVKSQKIKGSNNPRINNIANQKNLILEEFKNNIDTQIHKYDYVYNGSVQGGGSVPAFYISHEKGGSVDTRTFKKVTSITSGKKYLIYSNGKIAGFIGSDYGYLPGVEAEVVDDVIFAEEINSYEITETAEGYTIKQSDGRFMYLKNTYNSMNFSAQPASGHFWSISKEDDDSFLIQNVLKGKTLQYDTSYGNFACYSSYNGTRIFMYEMSE